VTEVGHFWFVAANIRTYSALVADLVPAHEATSINGLWVGPRSKRQFWDALASRDPHWLRRRGWPTSIAGRAAYDFPGGSVSYHLASGTVQIVMDAELAAPIYQREVANHFGFELGRASFQLTSGRLMRPVAPPKPWY